MEPTTDWRKAPKDGRDRLLNRETQPFRQHVIFNNPKIVTEGWYPVCKSKYIKKQQAQSFEIGNQRILFYRGTDLKMRAMDSYCPHMGADLANGRVVNNRIQCYFHRWEYEPDGRLSHIPCKSALQKSSVQLQTYPVEEKYGFVWVYSAPTAPGPMPSPPGLSAEHDVEGFFVASSTLFVHHHVMFVSAIDLQHFATVHNLDAEFSYDVSTEKDGSVCWHVEGKLPQEGFKSKLGRFFLGDAFRYRALFSGGSLVSLSYGVAQTLRGRNPGISLPSAHVLWGVRPQQNGTSQVYIFFVQKKRKGPIGWVTNKILFGLTFILLYILKDEDVQAFPHMRFQAQNLIEKDSSVARLIQTLNALKASKWSYDR